MRSKIRKKDSFKKRTFILSFLILLLCLSTCYAYLSKSLKINTVANVDKMTWDVHLENVVVRNGSVSAIPPVISSDKTGVSLTVSFTQPHEYYEYYVDVVNSGSIDAQVENIYKTTLTSSQAKYMDYKITYKDGLEIKRNDLLRAGERETLKVLVYIKDLHESLYPTINETLKLEGSINYIQKNDDGEIRNKQALYEEIKKQAQSDNNVGFGVIPIDANSGVYTLSRTSSYAYPIYYYRGDVENNNVLFANFCWKIVRTTTTGGIKLIYNGIPNNGVCDNTGEDTLMGASAFNTESNDTKYVGYMYDNNTKDSTIKEYIDTWFANNLLAYLANLEDTPFYNERDYVEKPGYLTYAPKNRIWGTELSDEEYQKHISKTTVKLGATNIEDIFTVSSDIGNGALTYPVGLITSDEIIMARARKDVYFLNIKHGYWTISPTLYYQGLAMGIFVDERGITNFSSVFYLSGVRPVISILSSSAFISGNGTTNEPYIMAN